MRIQKLTMIVGESIADDGAREEQTCPAMVNLEAVRCFYPRKPGPDGAPRTGARITFTDGGGMAVAETFEELSALYTVN